MKEKIYIDLDGQELTKKTWENGTVYYKNKKGELHRLDGPAWIERDGYTAWFMNSIRHRLDGPAVSDPGGYQAWYSNGKVHRLDGPSVIWKNGKEQYYLEGKEVSRKEIDLIWLRKHVGK